MEEIRGKSVSALWGEILKQSADEEKINTQSADDEPLYAVGKDVLNHDERIRAGQIFYKLKVKMTGRRRKMRIKRSSSTMHFTQRQSKTAILVTDEQVQAYIEDMKLSSSKAWTTAKIDIQDVGSTSLIRRMITGHMNLPYTRNSCRSRIMWPALNDEYNEKR